MLGIGLGVATPRRGNQLGAAVKRIKTWLAEHGDLPVASTPAAISVRAAQAVPSFAPASFYGLDDGRFDVLTRNFLVDQGTAQLNDGVSRRYYKAVYSVTGTDPIMIVRFRTNARYLGILYWSTPSQFQFVVDGALWGMQFFNAGTAGGARHVLELDFGSSAEREIVMLTRCPRVAGIFLPTGATLSAPGKRSPVVGNIGDSYSQGAGERFIYGLSFGIASRLGTPMVLNDAVGGSGFVMDNGGISPNQNSFADRVAYAAPNQTSPKGIPVDLTLTIGGANDRISMSASDVLGYLQMRRAQQPLAISVVIGPQCPRGDHAVDPGQRYLGLASTIKTALASLPGPWVYVDPLSNTWRNSVGATGGDNDGPWITGVGRRISFTAALTGATGGTLTEAWNMGSGSHTVTFSDGSTRISNLTSGGTTVSWTGAVSASAEASAHSVDGTAKLYVTDGTHLNAAGTEYWSGKAAGNIRAGVAAL